MNSTLNSQGHRARQHAAIRALVVILFWVSSDIPVGAKIIRVSEQGNGSDGMTWETAYKKPADAVAASVDGDEIWVKEGYYFNSFDVDKEVALYGGFEGIEDNSDFSNRDWRRNPTYFIQGDPGEYGQFITVWEPSLVDGFMIESTRRAIHAFATVVVKNCNINNNGGFSFATGISTGDFGVGVTCINCLFYRNETFWESHFNEGAAIFVLEQHTGVHIENCTFAQNRTVNNPEGASIFIEASDQGDVVIKNTIIRDVMKIEGRAADITYSNILGGYPGEGNIDEDPMFYNAINFDLLPDSPCVDSATKGPSLDLYHNPRPIDIPGRGVEGADAYDMGALELQLEDVPSPTPIPTATQTPTPTLNPNSDINEDGFRDASDLLLLLRDWHRVSSASQ